MRARFPFATGTWYHVMSFDITQYHDRTVPELSQVCRTARQLGLCRQHLHNGARLLLACSGLHDAFPAPVVSVAAL